MEVIILAGGSGNRLKSVISDIPKPMAEIRNKPFLEFIFTWLSEFNIDKIVLSVGYKAEIIKSHFGSEFHRIPLEYSYEQEPLGTGGGILKALQHVDDEYALVINGDTYFPINPEHLLSAHLTMDGMITVALKKMTDFERYGTVNIDNENNIVRFHEKKPTQEGLINGGIYLIDKHFIQSLILPEKFSFERDVLEKHTVGNQIKGMIFQEPFIDIGIPEDYFKAGQIL